MAAGTFAHVRKYLSAGYQPDREYIEGEIRERNAGGLKDGALRARIAGILQAWQDQMQVDVLLQKRLRIAPERFRVPDICAVHRYMGVAHVWVLNPFSKSKPMNSALTA